MMDWVQLPSKVSKDLKTALRTPILDPYYPSLSNAENPEPLHIHPY
jgi:hypothetical protein